jgi:hypothetical protein
VIIKFDAEDTIGEVQRMDRADSPKVGNRKLMRW